MDAYIYSVFITLVGLCFGSFANVIIYRLPKNKSIISPRSACVQCKKKLAWYHNIPVVSWLFLRGQCAYCKAKISSRYPFVELLMGLVFFSTYQVIGPEWFLVECLYLSFALIVVSMIDFDHYILPDVFTLSGIVIGLFGAFLNPEREFLDAFLGGLFGGGILWGVALLYFLWRKQEGMGGGDIKLLAWIGTVLGLSAVPFIIMFASLLGTFVGLFLLFYKENSLKSALPFGPYLSLAAIVYFLGESEIKLFLDVFIER